MYACMYMCVPEEVDVVLLQNAQMYGAMGWLRLVGSIKLYVTFAQEPYKSDNILQKRLIEPMKRDNSLQKRPIIQSILLTVATSYSDHDVGAHLCISLFVCWCGCMYV